MIVLPELAISGYDYDDAAQAAASAIDADDDIFAEWSRAGRGAVVVGGVRRTRSTPACSTTARFSSTAPAIRALYRKTHLWDDEALYFEPGAAPAPVVDTAVGRIGVVICYDLEFPEMTRALALRGAELLAVPTNWPLVDRPAGEHPPERIIAMAAARVNRMAIACSDRTHHDGGRRYTEGTAIIDAHGWVVTRPLTGVGSVAAEIDLDVARVKDISTRNHLFHDRRPDLYGYG